jgi:hypothetical protein
MAYIPHGTVDFGASRCPNGLRRYQEAELEFCWSSLWSMKRNAVWLWPLVAAEWGSICLTHLLCARSVHCSSLDE